MKGSISALLLFGSLLLILPNAASGDSVIISGHPEYPPVMYKNQKGTITGVGPELASMILSELGVGFVNKFTGPWARVQKYAKKGEIDIVAGIYKTPERETYLRYIPTAFMANPAVIFLKKGNRLAFHRWEDLKGLTGGAIIGDRFKPEFEQFLEKNQADIKIERVSSLNLNFLKLTLGRIDFVPYGKYPGLIKLAKMDLSDKVEFLPTPIFHGLFYLAVSKKSDERLKRLIPLIDQKIMELKHDGTVERLIDKHLRHCTAVVKPS